MSDYNIVIAERGWVYVGLTRREGDQIVIEDCQNVRRWGTSSGLGEIALKGPTVDTILDHYGVVRVHVLAICGQIDCDDELWKRLRGKR
jgi:hypothetical protein